MTVSSLSSQTPGPKRIGESEEEIRTTTPPSWPGCYMGLAGNMATTPGHLLGDVNDEPNRRTEVA